MGAPVIGPGTIVDGYQLTKQLGEGPFGVVFLGKDIRRGTHAALKLLKPHIINQAVGRSTFSRLLASLKAYAELSHPSLAGVLRAVQDPESGAYGLALEHVDGQSLDRVSLALATPDRRALDARRLARFVAIYEQLARLLAWLHQRGVVHGNLKPSNVMVLPGQGDVQIKVLDLCWSAIGVARPPAGVETFLSPEQLDGVPPTVASDQWTLAEMMQRALVAGAQGVALARETGLPPALVVALDRARKLDPAARYADVAELAELLHAVRLSLEDEPTDRRTEAVKAPAGVKPASLPPTPVSTKPLSIPPSSSRPAAPAPAALGVTIPISVTGSGKSAKPADLTRAPVEEPATVRVPVAPPRAVMPSVDKPSAARSSLGSRGALDDVRAGALGSHDLPFDLKAEPSLALDSLTMPPDAHLSPRAGTRAKKGVSPLALAGAALILVATGVILGTSRWLDAPKSPDPAAEVRTDANEPAKVDVAKADVAKVDVAKVDVAKVDVAKADTKIDEKTIEPVAKADPGTAEGKGKVTRMPDVPLVAEPVAKGTGPSKGATPSKGPATGANKALDAKADAAMARLASLGTEGVAEPAAPEGAKKRHEVGCDEGDGGACLELGKLWRAEKSDDKARSAYERACAFNNADGCHRAADLTKSASRAAELEAKACTLGRAASCKTSTSTTP
jgi:serine/threonine protein kinase